MSKRTVGFIVGGAAVVVVVLAVVLLLEKKIKSPCSSNQEPDTILEPLANQAAMRVSGGDNDSLCVYCIAPCEGGDCNAEGGSYADYTAQIVDAGTQITLTPKSESDGNEGETIMEIKKLPDNWSEEDIYGEYHFLIYQIRCENGVDCEDQFYMVQYKTSPQATDIIMTFSESAPISALKE